jgi:hypothetical protein
MPVVIVPLMATVPCAVVVVNAPPLRDEVYPPVEANGVRDTLTHAVGNAIGKVIDKLLLAVPIEPA